LSKKQRRVLRNSVVLMTRSDILGAAFVWAAVLPAYAESDITLSGNAALLTQYVDRGITNSAERPAMQAAFDLYYKEIYYAGIWGSNVNFGTGPNGQDLASTELDLYVGFAPSVGKWSFDVAAYYVAYSGAFDPDGDFNYVEIWTGVSRSFLNDKLKLTVYNYWSPEYFGETGNNDVLELSYEWTFNKVWYFTPKLAGNVGRQWGALSQGGYDYTYWSIALKLGFNENPSFEFEVRYWDSTDFTGFTCAPSGVDACHDLVVGSLKAAF
jgi:uncharacterized protein (TIGR02001 family)